jgi:hypothetical protein
MKSRGCVGIFGQAWLLTASLWERALDSSVVDAAVRAHQRGLALGDVGEPHAHRQLRPPVRRAEGVEVEREGRGGEEDNQTS